MRKLLTILMLVAATGMISCDSKTRRGSIEANVVHKILIKDVIAVQSSSQMGSNKMVRYEDNDSIVLISGYMTIVKDTILVHKITSLSKKPI